MKEIFQSRQLFINDSNITNEYIRYIRPIKENNKIIYKHKNNQDFDNENYYHNNSNKQINLEEYYKLCNSNILLDYGNIDIVKDPIISIILPSFNKQNEILKSIRSIQNQSFRNIEIIIVDDCSTDNSKNIYKYLLETDHRIRIFFHLKNMGVWRSRLDGFLYSRGKYVIHFDTGDLYANNWILEKSYNLVVQYNLDSIRFSFKMVWDSNNLNSNTWEMKFKKKDTKIILGPKKYDIILFDYGTIWNRLTRANIFTKSLNLIDSYILNAYKNLWEDRWWNTLANYMSLNYLMINNVGYLYLPGGGEGNLKLGDDITNEKTIKEFIYFWLFDYQLLPRKDNKKSIIKILYQFNRKTNKIYGLRINLSFLKKPFKIYDHLLQLLINDPYISDKDKNYVSKIYSRKIQ